MSNLFQKLFNHAHKGKDSLTQPQREAIVDLLFYCMYADNNIALNEDQLISDTVEQFAWDPKISYESYTGKSLAAARAAKETPEARADFLASAANRLGSREVKLRALALCRKLFQSDGDVSVGEQELLSALQKTLG